MFKLILLILGFYLGMVIYVIHVENTRTFFPERDILLTPQSLDIEFQDVYLKTADNVKINGWFIPKEGALYTVLFFHGNAGNIGDRVDKIGMFYNMGVNMFIVDYRGYGRSLGRPCEKGMYLDARAAYDYLVNQQGVIPQSIIVYGESLGGGVAVDLTAKAQVGGLILEGSFTNIRDLAKKLYPFLSLFLISNKFNSLEKIKDVTVPKLFVHSRNDEVVPFSLGEKLYHQALPYKQIVELEGSHNTIHVDSQDKYVSAIKEFIGNKNRFNSSN